MYTNKHNINNQPYIPPGFYFSKCLKECSVQVKCSSVCTWWQRNVEQCGRCTCCTVVSDALLGNFCQRTDAQTHSKTWWEHTQTKQQHSSYMWTRRIHKLLLQHILIISKQTCAARMVGRLLYRQPNTLKAPLFLQAGQHETKHVQISILSSSAVCSDRPATADIKTTWCTCRMLFS